MRKGMPTGKMEEETRELLDYYNGQVIKIYSNCASASVVTY